MLDTLVRSLCYKDSLSFITSYDVATMDYLNFNQQLKQKIADLEWLNIFERLLKAVNLNIANEGYFLNTDCMENIKNLDMNAPQPYYNILQTLQCAFQENWTDFTININIAIQKCSDLELLKMLERMKISYIAKIHINVSDKVITEINSGINYLNIGNFEEAKNAFQKAKNWQSNFAFPDFMLGEVCVATGEFSRAEIYYDNAILKQQQYFEPIYAKLYLMLKNNDHESALQLLNSGFSANSWYSYFLLGRIYLMQNNNKKAKKYLELAANINSSNFDLLIFQGDVYKNLNDKKNAEMYYKKAGTLDPENDVFTSRLQELK